MYFTGHVKEANTFYLRQGLQGSMTAFVIMTRDQSLVHDTDVGCRITTDEDKNIPN